MKYSATQYGKMFSSLLEKSPKNKRKEAIKSFASMLYENGDIKNSADIVYAAEKALYEKSKGLKVELTEAKSHHFNLPEKIGHKNVELKKTVNEKLIGGVKIKIGDIIIDNSVESRMKNLKNAFK